MSTTAPLIPNQNPAGQGVPLQPTPPPAAQPTPQDVIAAVKPDGGVLGNIAINVLRHTAQAVVAGDNTLGGASIETSGQGNAPEEPAQIDATLQIPPPPPRFSVRGNVAKEPPPVISVSPIAHHVAHDSHLEKLIQQVNTSFKGTAPAPINHDDTEEPPHIEKGQAPVQAGLVDAARHAISPRDMETIKSIAGTGPVSSSGSQRIVKNLLNTGFSAQVVAEGYKNIKSVTDAFKDQDENAARYELTFALVSGALSTAGRGVVADRG